MRRIALAVLVGLCGCSVRYTESKALAARDGGEGSTGGGSSGSTGSATLQITECEAGGTGTVQVDAVSQPFGTFPSNPVLATGDIDGDGATDLVLSGDGAPYFQLFIGKSDGTFDDLGGGLDQGSGRARIAAPGAERPHVVYAVGTALTEFGFLDDAGFGVVSEDALADGSAVAAIDGHFGVALGNVVTLVVAYGSGTIQALADDQGADYIQLATTAPVTDPVDIQVLRYADGGNAPRVYVLAGGSNPEVDTFDVVAGVVKRVGTAATGLQAHNPVFTVADFDGDGQADAVVAAPDADAVAVFWGTADGGLEAPQTFSYPDPVAVGAADLDGDGLPELVVGENGRTGANLSSVGIYRNLGGRHFLGPPAVLDGGREPLDCNVGAPVAFVVGLAALRADGQAEVVVLDHDHGLKLLKVYP